MTTITGSTRLFGIIADPVSQVRTPEVLNAYFAEHGIDAVMVPMHVGSEGLPAVMQAFRQMKNLGGIIVTVPHKTDVAALCTPGLLVGVFKQTISAIGQPILLMVCAIGFPYSRQAVASEACTPRKCSGRRAPIRLQDEAASIFKPAFCQPSKPASKRRAS